MKDLSFDLLIHRLYDRLVQIEPNMMIPNFSLLDFVQQFRSVFNSDKIDLTQTKLIRKKEPEVTFEKFSEKIFLSCLTDWL